jgi:hypothetical protein
VSAESVHAPSLYGYRIETQARFRFLRVGGGVEPMGIVVTSGQPVRPTDPPLAEWALRGTSYPARAALYQRGRSFEFWTTDTGRFFIDPDQGLIEVPAMDDAVLREQRLCGIPMILSYAHRGDFSLHAAAVEMHGGAVLLVAPSRAGKTTLALGFHLAGYRVLSEDLVCCRPGRLEVLPGPALVRPRPDVLAAAEPAGMSVVHRRPDRVFLSIDEDRRGSSGPVPVRGIVFLHASDSLRMEPIPAAAVIGALWNLSFHLPTDEDRARSFRNLAHVAGRIPAWDLHRPLRLDELDRTVALIARTTA